MDWHLIFQIPTDLLHLEIPPLEKIFRSVAVYAFLLVVFRLAGKRQLAQINTLDLIVLLTISNTVQNAIIGPDDSLLGGLIGAAALVGINAILVSLLYRKPKLAEIIEGKPCVLMEDGRLLQDAMEKEEISEHELEETLQQQGHESLKEMERIVLETTGNITFTLRRPSIETRRHDALMKRLDTLSQEIEQLKASK